MAALNSIQETFFEECEDLLEALSSGLSQMQAGEGDSETMNAVFRAVHSIKGGAGAFALSDLVAFAHRFETVLDGARAGRITLDGDGFRVLFRATDHLSDHVACAKTGQQISSGVTGSILQSLDDFLSGDETALSPDADFSFFAVPLDLGDLKMDALSDQPGHAISFRPHAALFANGHEPAWILRSLAQLGDLSARLVLPQMPDWRRMDLAEPLMCWEMTLGPDADEAAIRASFEFVEGLCELDIRPLPGGAETARSGATQPLDTQPPLADPVPAHAASMDLPVSEPAPDRPAPLPITRLAEGHATSQTLRVDLDRVDRLINAVGELITNHAAIAQQIDEMALPTGAEIKTHIEDYHLLARDIQEAVMAIRAQPVKPLFQRMARIVREAADATGKAAQLVTSGDNVEVDKTVIERLADPLTHMIRNAVDHGLETPQDRSASGKPASGTIGLSASHRSGRVVITIRDDGAGLDRPKILSTARRKGLIPAEAELTDPEIDALLFMPGFSTASAISNLSGRGVGLDVVRTAVTALGGRITINSTPGQGTEFTLSVPLTLAVMDGMVVSVGGQTMVVPIASILETIRPEAADLNRMGTSHLLLAIRGRFIPVIDVAETLGLVAARPEGITPLLLLVEAEDQNHYALAVDDVQDQRQVVIKGLDANYGAIPGVSAATVLGNGQIALILDTDAIASGRDMAAALTRSHPNGMEGNSHGTQ